MTRRDILAATTAAGIGGTGAQASALPENDARMVQQGAPS